VKQTYPIRRSGALPANPHLAANQGLELDHAIRHRRLRSDKSTKAGLVAFFKPRFPSRLRHSSSVRQKTSGHLMTHSTSRQEGLSVFQLPTIPALKDSAYAYPSFASPDFRRAASSAPYCPISTDEQQNAHRVAGQFNRSLPQRRYVDFATQT